MGARRVLAAGVSATAALLVLCVAAWILLGNKDGTPEPEGDVQIIPPIHATEIDSTAGPADRLVSAASGEDTPPPPLVVYITGEVVNPGVYTVAPGHRLSDVVDLAGGPTEIADLDRVNLAAHISDAGHYRIPTLGASADVPVGFGLAATVQDETATNVAPSVATCAVPININSATAECLETLPGIGSVRAESIVEYREQSGPFVVAEGITAVSGIGDGIYGRIADKITVDER